MDRHHQSKILTTQSPGIINFLCRLCIALSLYIERAFWKYLKKGNSQFISQYPQDPNIWTSSIKANPYRLLRVQRPVIFCANGPKKNTTQFNYENLLKADTLCSILQSPALTIGKKKRMFPVWLRNLQCEPTMEYKMAMIKFSTYLLDCEV